MTASAYLSYGGVLRVLRSSNKELSNANVPVGAAVTNLQINSQEDFYNNYTQPTSLHYAARSPAFWSKRS